MKASTSRAQRIYGPHQICDLRRVQYTCPEALILSKVGSVCEREEEEGGRGGKKGREIEEGLEGELREHDKMKQALFLMALNFYERKDAILNRIRTSVKFL